MATLIRKDPVFLPRLGRADGCEYRLTQDTSVGRYNLHRDGALLASSINLHEVLAACGNAVLQDEATLLAAEQAAAEAEAKAEQAAIDAACKAFLGANDWSIAETNVAPDQGAAQ